MGHAASLMRSESQTFERWFHGFSEIIICQFLENTFRGLYANIFKKPPILNKSFFESPSNFLTVASSFFHVIAVSF